MKNYSLRLQIFCLLIIVGCASAPQNEKVASSEDPNYEQQIIISKEQVHKSQNQDSDEEKIDAALIASAENDYETVARILSSIKSPEKNSYLKSNFLIIEAEKAIHLNKPTRAFKILETFFDEAELDPAYKIRISGIKAEAHYLEKDFAARAKELISISSILKTSKKRSNAEEIFRSLMMLSEEKLNALLQESLSFDEQGWILLTLVVKSNSENLGNQFFAFEEWKRNWAGHPANAIHPARLAILPEMINQSPKTVALILPLTDDYSKFGEAVRDGFIAAHFQSEEKKKIMVYDSNSSDIIEIIEQASKDGADVIVGPLDRKKVASLLTEPILPVKTLALNRTEDYNDQTNLFQFGLAPEDESEQAAKKAYESGYRRALVIAPETEWGDRNHKAFTKAFSMLGGKTVESARFSSQKDYSSLVRKLFKIGSSEDRASKLSRVIGKKLEFKARRRKDIDFIFLLANNSQARGIKPTISFFYGEDLPVYATSHINRNSENRLDNIDLNGIYFCEMPWNLKAQNRVKTKIMETWEENSNGLAPFFALGADAHKLIQRMEQLEKLPYDPIFGTTGMLSMNSDQKIKRTLEWAKFEDSSVKINEPRANQE